MLESAAAITTGHRREEPCLASSYLLWSKIKNSKSDIIHIKDQSQSELSKSSKSVQNSKSNGE